MTKNLESRDTIKIESMEVHSSCHTQETKSQSNNGGSKDIPHDAIFVGNLSYFCTEEILSSLFSRFGVVLSVSIQRSRKNLPLHYGFLDMPAADAEKAIRALNNIVFMGRQLRVSWRQGNTDLKGSAEKVSMHVSFLSFSTDFIINEEYLSKIFGVTGGLMDSVVKHHRISTFSHKQTGYAFLYFQDEESADRALTMYRSYNGVIAGVTYDCKRILPNAPLQVGNTSSSSKSPLEKQSKFLNTSSVPPYSNCVQSQVQSMNCKNTFSVDNPDSPEFVPIAPTQPHFYLQRGPYEAAPTSHRNHVYMTPSSPSTNATSVTSRFTQYLVGSCSSDSISPTNTSIHPQQVMQQPQFCLPPYYIPYSAAPPAPPLQHNAPGPVYMCYPPSVAPSLLLPRSQTATGASNSVQLSDTIYYSYRPPPSAATAGGFIHNPYHSSNIDPSGGTNYFSYSYPTAR